MVTFIIRLILCVAAVLTLGRGLYFLYTSIQLKGHLVSSKGVVIKDIPPTSGGKVADADPSALFAYKVDGREYQSWADISLDQYQLFKTNPSVAIYYRASHPATAYIQGLEPTKKRSEIQIAVGLVLSFIALLALFKLNITPN